MARVITDDQNYINIASTIRDKAGVEKTYAPSQMPEGIEKVYEAGQADKEEVFWKAITADGTRTNTQQAFCYWSSKYIRPKLNGKDFLIQPTSSSATNQTFANNAALKIVESKHFDFSKKTRGTVATAAHYYTFSGCTSLEEIEDVGIKADHTYNATFRNCTSLHTIANIEVDENTVFIDETFSNCTSLVNLGITGTLGAKINKFNLRWSTKLSRASIENIFEVLSTETSGLSITLSKDAVNKAFETAEGLNDGSTSTEWLELRATRTNWTINLL